MRRQTKLTMTAIILSASVMVTGCSQPEEVLYEPETTTTATTTTAEEPEETTTAETTTTAADTTTTTSAEETTATTTTPATTATEATTVSTTELVPEWTESSASGTLYVNTSGIYSRKEAIMGSATVKQYNLNDKVTVVAVTNTDYYKLSNGSFIHMDYLSSSEVTVTTTTTTTVTTTAAPSAPANAEKLLNSAPLNPMKTNDADVDQMVANILSQITNNSMTTYQKVVAIYNYIIQNSTYGQPSTFYMSSVNYNMMLDSVITSQAYTLLETHIGVCDDYSSLFLVMTRAIGLETYLVYGQVATKSGGTTGHTWANIKLNGEYYIFDPQVEQNNLVNGQIQYNYFCRTDASAANVYTYEVSPIMEICAMYYNGETVTVNGARDMAIKLFGNFEIGDGFNPYVFVG